MTGNHKKQPADNAFGGLFLYGYWETLTKTTGDNRMIYGKWTQLIM